MNSEKAINRADTGYTETDMIESMIVWEAVISQNSKQFKPFIEQNGTCELRDAVLPLIQIVSRDWSENASSHNDGEGFDGSFDWDWVPEWLGQCVVVTDSEILVRPDHAEIARTIRIDWIKGGHYG